MLATDNKYFHDATARAVADARAYAGRLSPVVITSEGLRVLTELALEFGPRGSTARLLTTRDALRFIDPTAVPLPCRVAVGVDRRSPRRGAIVLRMASITDVASGEFDVAASERAALDAVYAALDPMPATAEDDERELSAIGARYAAAEFAALRAAE